MAISVKAIGYGFGPVCAAVGGVLELAGNGAGMTFLAVGCIVTITSMVVRKL